MDIQGFSERAIDLAERLSDIADAAEGKNRRRASATPQWLVLPAVGAGLYALARSDFFSTRAKGVVDEAKTLATDLPDDLMSGVRKASRKSSPAQASTTARKASSTTQRSAGRSGGQRRRHTSAAGGRKSRS
jgi:hypothetical protein